jgi:hypothetical protein
MGPYHGKEQQIGKSLSGGPKPTNQQFDRLLEPICGPGRTDIQESEHPEFAKQPIGAVRQQNMDSKDNGQRPDSKCGGSGRKGQANPDAQSDSNT